jgi:hypothetical protein
MHCKTVTLCAVGINSRIAIVEWIWAELHLLGHFCIG